MSKIIQGAIIVVIIIILFGFLFSRLTAESLLVQKQIKENIVGNPNVVPQAVVSYYKKYNNDLVRNDRQNNIVVGFHYTNWCGYCQLMKPVWEQVKQNLSCGDYSGIILLENDETKNPTPGVDSYPTIIRYQNGSARKYKGHADYQELRTWILNPVSYYPD